MSRRTRPPWYLLLPAVATFVGVLVPLGYLLVRAADADPAELRELVFRSRNFELLVDTLLLVFGVVATSTLVAFPLAWLVTRTDLPGRPLVTILAVLPLAIPGYVIAYSLLALGTPYGPVYDLIRLVVPRPGGYWGSLLVLTIYNVPLMFLNLRTGMVKLDPSLAEAARSLGCGPATVLRRVTLPQLLPAFLAGALLVGLYVLGDFGVVSLMRYETFSYAIFLQYTASYDRVYAACLALILLVLTSGFLVLEFRLLRELRLERVGLFSGTAGRVHRLGAGKLAAYPFVAGVVLVSVVVPIGVILLWTGSPTLGVEAIGVTRALLDSLEVSVPASILAAALAVPLGYLSIRYATGASRFLERSAFVGYATPALAFALGLIFFALKAAPWLYQTALLLVFAYVAHFLALAVGPVRTSLYVASTGLEEASRSLGLGLFATLRRVTLPLLRPGLVAAVILVYLSCMKELPLTYLLAPLDFQPLAIAVYDYAAEALFAEAAPYALTLVAISVLLSGLLFGLARERT